MTKILLVEDDETMISLLHTLLQLEGYQVTQTREEKIEEILNEIRTENPDLTLVDVHLRQVNGLEILKRIRQDADINDICVLMSSGMDLSSECLEAGADDFILKPYMPDELLHKIHHLLDGSSKDRE